jgi:Zn-dependent M28 family amino/carboxypeptidase
MKKFQIVILFFGLVAQAQKNPSISTKEVTRIVSELASDKMQGRALFTEGIDSASVFIEKEFSRIGLKFYGDLKNYRQEFTIKSKPANNVIGILPGKSKPKEYVIFSAHYDHLGMREDGTDKIYNGANDDDHVTAVIGLQIILKN